LASSSSPRLDFGILFSFVILVAVGLLMIYSTTFNDFPDSMWSIRSSFGTQAAWAVLSLIVVLVFSNIDWHFWDAISAGIYGLGVLLLLLVLLIGSEIKGAKSWLIIGPFSLQPGEFAKVSTALAVSSLLSSVYVKLDQYKSQLYLLGLLLIPAILISSQPDPGSALTYFSLIIVYYRFGMPVPYYLALIAVFFVIILSLTMGFYVAACAILLLAVVLSGKFSSKDYINILLLIVMLLLNVLLYQFGYMPYALIATAIYFIVHFVLLFDSKLFRDRIIVAGSVALLTSMSFLSTYAFDNILLPHQQDRINVWLNPEKSDPRGSYYNLAHSKLAIGSGGLSGKGYLEGTMTKLNYVPEQTTDFIFSSIGEEQGFIGGAAVIVAFLFLVLKIIKVGEQSQVNFCRAFCYCVAGFLFVHFFINIGMTMGISPVIGIPLPFISKGGSSLMAFSIMIGIVLNISKQRR